MRFLFPLLTTLVLACIASAGISAPNSSVTPSRDGTRFLVMLSPEPNYDQAPIATLPDGRTLNLHDRFSKSGVYDSATLEPIWQVDWFALEWDLLCSDDLQHILRRNRRGFHSDWALAFYERGELIRSYDCASLLTGMNHDRFLPYSTWDWHTQWYEDFELDSQQKTVLFSTPTRRLYLAGSIINLHRKEFYSFDLATGAMLTQKTVGAWVVWAYLIALMVVLGALYVITHWIWRKIKLQLSSRQKGFPIVPVMDAHSELAEESPPD